MITQSIGQSREFMAPMLLAEVMPCFQGACLDETGFSKHDGMGLCFQVFVPSFARHGLNISEPKKHLDRQVVTQDEAIVDADLMVVSVNSVIWQGS